MRGRCELGDGDMAALLKEAGTEMRTRRFDENCAN